MKLKFEDLPLASRNRLASAIQSPQSGSFVISRSKIAWAWTGIVVGILTVGGLVNSAHDFRWSTEERAWAMSWAFLGFLTATLGVRYLLAGARATLKDLMFLNPLYFLRIRFNEIDVHLLTSAKDWKVDHFSERGAYAGSKFSFFFENSKQTFKVASIHLANELVRALNAYPKCISDLIEREDMDSMYAIDPLFEWRLREKQYPSGAAEQKSNVKDVTHKYAAPVLTALVTGILFFAFVDQLNDRQDDKKRWESASTTKTAAGYRVYLASRPGGRYDREARMAIDELYERAAAGYRQGTGLESSPGIDAVVAILEYARRSGHYRVYVKFEGDNQIPEDIEDRLLRAYGRLKLVPILPSFTSEMNHSRESLVLQRIKTSFGRVIPGDILDFRAGPSEPREINFNVDYILKASGSLYYPESQEKLPEARRDWYTGISFDWTFEILVPDQELLPYQFSLASRPAELFRVAYKKYSNQDRALTAGEVYDAMADSAFENFSAKLFSSLSLEQDPATKRKPAIRFTPETSAPLSEDSEAKGKRTRFN